MTTAFTVKYKDMFKIPLSSPRTEMKFDINPFSGAGGGAVRDRGRRRTARAPGPEHEGSKAEGKQAGKSGQRQHFLCDQIAYAQFRHLLFFLLPFLKRLKKRSAHSRQSNERRQKNGFSIPGTFHYLKPDGSVKVYSRYGGEQFDRRYYCGGLFYNGPCDQALFRIFF